MYPSRSGFWYSLRNDRTLFLTCLMIALIFWIFVKLSDEYRTEIQVTLEYDTPDNLMFAATPTTRADALLRGSGWELLPIYARKGTITQIDLRNQQSDLVFEMSIREVVQRQLGVGLEVLNVEPNTLNFQLEAIAEKRVPLRPSLDLHFSDDYHLRKPPALSPDSVLVRGPASLIDSVAFWVTDTLRLENLKSDYADKIGVLQDPDKLLLVEPRIVDIRCEVEPVVEKTLFVPVQVRNAPDSVRIFPSSIRITFVVGMSRFDSLKVTDFELVADLKEVEISSSNTLIPVSMLRKPADVRGVRYSPQMVEMLIQLSE